MPVELQTGQYITKFGAWAVMGRPLYLHEIKEIIIAENVENAYRSRRASGDWAKWTSENQTMAEILSRLGHE